MIRYAKKILVVRFSSLGDAVLTIPVFNNLKIAYPESELVLLTKETYAPFFKNHPLIDRLLTIGPGQGLAGLIPIIRKEHFDIMIDLHDNIRSHIVSLTGNFKRVVSYKKDSLARRLMVFFKKNSPNLQMHTIEKYLEVLRRLNIPVGSASFSMAGDNDGADVGTTNMQQMKALKQKKPYYTVLVFQTAFVGDLVLTVPLLQAIKKNLSCHLMVCTTPQGADVFKTSGAVDEIIVYDKKGSHRSFMSYIQLVRTLRSRNIDIAIVPHRLFKSALTVFFAGIPCRIGFAASAGKFLFNHLVPFNWNDHDALRNLALLFPLGIYEQNVEWNVVLTQEMKSYASAIIKSKGWGKDTIIIGINPGSTWRTKQWISERFAQTADRLSQQWTAGIILFGGPRDIPVVQRVREHVQTPVLDMCGKTNLRQLTALIAECDLFITNDSGPMHIAAAVNVPTIALFGPTTRELGFFPYGSKHRVIEVDLDCRPCGLHGGTQCPRGHFECMKRISVEMVVRTAEEMLKESKKARKQESD